MQNVNLTRDLYHAHPNNIMVDSKDAKAKIHAHETLVQKRANMWHKIVLPDHDWNRLAHNAVTLMTHLFLKTENILLENREHFERRTMTFFPASEGQEQHPLKLVVL